MSKKQVKKVTDKENINVPIVDEKLDAVIKCFDIPGSPESVRRAVKTHRDKYVDGNFSDDDKTRLLATQIVSINNLENQSLLLLTTKQEFLTFTIQLAKDLAVEYGCKTPSELVLAQAAAEAYGRVLSLSSYLNMNLNRESYTDLTVSRQKALSIDLDRAHRQYLASIQTLQQMKGPQLNIKTGNIQIAFVDSRQGGAKANNKPIYDPIDGQ